MPAVFTSISSSPESGSMMKKRRSGITQLSVTELGLEPCSYIKAPDLSTRPHCLWTLGKNPIGPRWMFGRSFSL